MNRTHTTIALIVTSALVAAACSGRDEEAAITTPPQSEATTTTVAESTTTRPSMTTTTVRASTTTTIPDVLRMPLTGEPIEDESEIPDRPALVVKISNAPLGQVMPHSGLNNADIVFEEVINDSATRLAAVFHSQEMDPVGPIRSGRAQDINLLLSLQKPLFAWSGGNPSVTRAIRDSDLVDLADGSASGFYRRSGRKKPNDLFSTTEALWEQDNGETGRPVTVFPYVRDGDEISGEAATTIDVTLDSLRAEWTYDEETDGYYRSQNGREHETETPDGVEPVWVENVVVMVADYGVNTFDGNPDAQVLGTNPVYVFTHGLVQQGSWLRFEPEDPFQFFDDFDALNSLLLQPGRTWVEIPRNVDDAVTWEG